MWTYVRIRSEYFESDSSRYRLAMTQQTLIRSLQEQSDMKFSIVLSVSAVDPYRTRRLQSFDTVGVPWYFDYELDLETPRRQIDVPDDYFLSPGLMECLNIADKKRSVRYDLSKGFLYQKGKLKEWNSNGQIQCQQITDAEEEVEELPWTWIVPRHQMNDDLRGDIGNEVKFKWSGWSEALVSQIAETKIVTGSALGCDLHPDRSRSILKGYKHYVNRGKVRRGKTVNMNGQERVLEFPVPKDPFRRTRGNRLRRRRKKNVR